jgi:uncharacterized membrane protein YgdD (TMEM256/DUF423 family)
MWTMDSSRLILLGASFAGIAVAGGAFGAHMLKPVLDSAMLGAFETGVRYQMYHGLALCLLAGLGARYPKSRVAAVGWLFVIGVALFSGSLYVLSLSGMRWVGAFTPIGGTALIAGWALLAWIVATTRP